MGEFQRVEYHYDYEGGNQSAPKPVGQEQRLLDDLTAPEYGFNADDAILLERKQDMKKRDLPSPDWGDALACTFAEPVAPRAVPNYLNPENYEHLANRGIEDRYDEL